MVRFQELYGNPGYLGHDERLREYANVGDFTKQAPTRGFIRGFVPFSLHHTQRVESAILPEDSKHGLGGYSGDIRVEKEQSTPA
jgi:hypothetical protein